MQKRTSLPSRIMQAPATAQDESLSVRNNPPTPTETVDPNHFPSRLHEMLGTIEDGDTSYKAKIVSWQPHGKCFLIKNKEEFIAKVLPE